MRNRFREWLSMQTVKRPGRVVLMAILLFNIVFLVLSAAIISSLSLSSTEQMGFFEAAFCTVTMVLDAGCIQFVVEDIGQAGVVTVLICLGIVIIGMISFTGAVIGYVTSTISSFIENADSGSQKLFITDHIVILNWNTRASEIINDLLYCGTKQKVVVLVGGRKKEIEKEIEERLSDTVSRENEALKNQSPSERSGKRFKRNVTVIVKEGDIFSSKQLHDIAIEHAKTIIILGSDVNNIMCKFEQKEAQREKGNSQTIKTLMQVADITASDYSDDNQKIIVEITDDWTFELVKKIIRRKQVDGKCNIVPVNINICLGQILSQFSLMPELNLVYRELFSNKGASFYSRKIEPGEERGFVSNYLAMHCRAIPLTTMESKNGVHAYYSANSDKEISRADTPREVSYTVDWNKNYWIEKKSIVILGHNSKCHDIMQGFAAFRNEWHYRDRNEEILRIIVIDDKENLEKMNNYREYPFVVNTVAASIFDREIICKTIEQFVSENQEDTSVLILSDDSALNENIDANALANLVYVQDIIKEKQQNNPAFDSESIDIIVEIIDPKHHDIVNSYSVNNVVISNRYISKMITQIGEKEALFDFYNDILTYDTDNSSDYSSKEVYTKKVSGLFASLPKPCFADELIRAVYKASSDESLSMEKQNPTIVLGYVKPGGRMVLFNGNQSEIKVKLEEKDKLIVFSKH